MLSVIEDLKAKGVSKENIIHINLDKRGFGKIKTADALEQIIDEQITNDEKKYIFIDETMQDSPRNRFGKKLC